MRNLKHTREGARWRRRTRKEPCCHERTDNGGAGRTQAGKKRQYCVATSELTPSEELDERWRKGREKKRTSRAAAKCRLSTTRHTCLKHYAHLLDLFHLCQGKFMHGGWRQPWKTSRSQNKPHQGKLLRELGFKFTK
jgi:hypothetical protein